MPKRRKKVQKASPIPLSKPAKKRSKKAVKRSGSIKKKGGFLSPVKFLLILLAIIAALIIKEKYFSEELPTQSIDLDNPAPVSTTTENETINSSIDTSTNLFSK